MMKARKKTRIKFRQIINRTKLHKKLIHILETTERMFNNVGCTIDNNCISLSDELRQKFIELRETMQEQFNMNFIGADIVWELDND